MLIIMPARKQEATSEPVRKEAMTSADEMRKEISAQTKKYYGTPPKVVKGSDIKGHEGKFDWALVQGKPRDWQFMEESRKTLQNLPETWTAYSSDEGGRRGILQMEYTEFLNANTKEEKMHELVHVASACLHLWRLYAGLEQ